MKETDILIEIYIDLYRDALSRRDWEAAHKAYGLLLCIKNELKHGA